MKIAAIANPYAGRGRTKTFAERFLPNAESRGHRMTMEWTRKAGDGIELAKHLASFNDVLCIIGGDGTIHEVVNGLMPNPIPIVIIPTGSGNDFAKLIPCPGNPEELQHTLEAGLGARLDILETGVRHCVNSVGLGFEALVTKHSRSIQHLSGIPLYLLAVFRALLSFSNPILRISLFNGEQFTGERLLVSIGNGVSAGGGFYLTPDACPDDGRADVCIISPMNRYRMLRMLPLALKGTHTGKAGIEMRSTEALTIETDTPCHLHIDGEYLGEKRWKLSVSVHKRILPVLCLQSSSNRVQQGIEKIL